eukprot:COSAG02_NODE_11314_length_1749_cov_1.529697_2_plen_87_part_00
MIPVDSTCVRVGSLRCHSQAITVKLTRADLDLEEINAAIVGHNEWVKLVPNTKESTIEQLTPAAVRSLADAVSSHRSHMWLSCSPF